MRHDLLQVNYSLTPESVVFDVGGHEGHWTAELTQHLGFWPRIYIFEPVQDFAAYLKNRFKDVPAVRVFHYGLGAHDDKMTFGIDHDRTGFWCEGTAEVVSIRDIADVMRDHNIDRVDLISINCEGGEYALLERMFEIGIERFDRIQIQFHNLFPGADKARDKIRRNLGATHIERYNNPWVWEAWTRCDR